MMFHPTSKIYLHGNNAHTMSEVSLLKQGELGRADDLSLLLNQQRHLYTEGINIHEYYHIT